MAKIGSSNMLYRRGMAVLLIILVLGFGTGVFRLVQLGIFDGEELQQRAVDQQLNDTTISAKRGTIYDTNGKILAQSATVWKVVMSPIYFKDDEERTIVSKGLSEILGKDQETIYEKTKESSYYVIVQRQIESDVKDKILEFIDKLEEDHGITGVVSLIEDYKRYYPYGEFASSVIGFTGSDGQGLEGIELKYDSQLTGTPGRLITAKNANGTEMPFKYEQKVDAEDGNNLVLTLDETIQHILEKYVDKGIEENKVINRAVAVMMDIKTGAVLGMAVEGGYDLNDPFTLVSDTEQKTIDALPLDQQNAAESAALSKQWRNKAVSDTYYPGSVWKIITSAMALQEGKITDQSRYNCVGYYVPFDGAQKVYCHNTSGHGEQTFDQALCNSCNPAFMMIGQSVGSAKFWEYYQAFGFSEKTGIDLPGESEDIFFSTDGSMQPMDLAVASFGQNFSITPIQMVTAVSAVANGGKLIQPYVVEQITDENGNVVESKEPTVKRQVISEEVSKYLSSVLEQNAQAGSGKNGYVAGYRVAGKTGTSEKLTYTNGAEDYIASFCGYAPANDPQVALLVYFDTPTGDSYYGSTVAAPVFSNIMSEVLPYLNVATQYTAEEIAQMDTTADNYVGMEAAAAKNNVEAGGFTAIVKGTGDKVLSQIPTAESRLPQGGTVVLYTDSDSVKDDAVEVPDLTGLTVSEANAVASQYDLNISISGSNSALEGISYAQDIPKGTKVSSGTVIAVSFEQDSNYGTGIM